MSPLLSLFITAALAGPGHQEGEVLQSGQAFTRAVFDLQQSPEGVAVDTRIIDVGDLPDGVQP